MSGWVPKKARHVESPRAQVTGSLDHLTRVQRTKLRTHARAVSVLILSRLSSSTTQPHTLAVSSSLMTCALGALHPITVYLLSTVSCAHLDFLCLLTEPAPLYLGSCCLLSID